MWKPTMRGASLCALLWGAMGWASAQFAYVPMPLPMPGVAPSQAQTPEAYRADAARVIYATFPMLVSRDPTEENLFDKALVAIDVEADGKVSEVRILRAPALDEIKPWLLSLIKKVERFPVPAQLKAVTYTDAWLFDDTGQFRLASMHNVVRAPAPQEPAAVAAPVALPPAAAPALAVTPTVAGGVPARVASVAAGGASVPTPVAPAPAQTASAPVAAAPVATAAIAAPAAAAPAASAASR